MTSGLHFASVLIISFAMLAGCSNPDSGSNDCSKSCEDGFRCRAESNVCIAEPLPQRNRTFPGYGLQIDQHSGRTLATGYAPTANRIFVGYLEDKIQRTFAFPPTDRVEESGLVLDATPNKAVVGWRASESEYQFGLHRARQNLNRWHISRRLRVQSTRLEPTFAFDASISASDAIHIVFQKGSPTELLYLEGRIADKEQQMPILKDRSELEAIDRPSKKATTCQSFSARKDTRWARYQPDIQIDETGTVNVAWTDPECGTLLLSQRQSDGWNTRIVDNGQRNKDKSHVGSFVSLDFADGNRAAIAYQNSSRGTLHWAIEKAKSSQFYTETVDSGTRLDIAARQRRHFVGHFNTMTFIQGQPVIAHLNSSTLNIVLNRRADTDTSRSRDWQRLHLTASSPFGFFPQILETPNKTIRVAAESLSKNSGMRQSDLELKEGIRF